MRTLHPFERRRQLSGIVLILGLLLEAFSLMGRGPVGFLVFAGPGGLFLFVGIVGYLLSLLGSGTTRVKDLE